MVPVQVLKNSTPVGTVFLSFTSLIPTPTVSRAPVPALDTSTLEQEYRKMKAAMDVLRAVPSAGSSMSATVGCHCVYARLRASALVRILVRV